jgi:hypothetical protein
MEATVSVRFTTCMRRVQTGAAKEQNRWKKEYRCLPDE